MISGLYDCHTHTYLSRHASGMPEDYAREAARAGLAGVIFTCHGPVPAWGRDHRMNVDELPLYEELVAETRKRWEGTLDVLLGLESDYMPGLEDWIAELHTLAPFDFILGSVHPFIDAYRERYWRGNPKEYARTYFSHVAEAAESGLFDSIGHLDVIKTMFPRDWKPEELEDEISACLARIAKAGTAIELNTSGLHKAWVELQPSLAILREARRRGIKVTLGSDAHEAARVGESFPEAVETLHEAGYTEVNYFRKRRAIAVDIREGA